MTPIAIDDPADPRLSVYRDLRDRDLAGHEGGVFIAEGKLVIRRLAASPYPVRSVLVTPARAAELADVLAGVHAPVYVASHEAIRATVGFDLHRGALAAAGRLPLPDPGALLAAARTVVVLEAVGDHENLGAIFRTCGALGADAVLLDRRCSDPLYRRCVRVSMGEVLHVPFTRLTPWPDALAGVRAAGFRVLALTPAPDATPIDLIERPAGDRVALLLGAEGDGLTPVALAAADERVRIPIRAGFDSLNVGHAAAIALHRLGLHREGQ